MRPHECPGCGLIGRAHFGDSAEWVEPFGVDLGEVSGLLVEPVKNFV